MPKSKSKKTAPAKTKVNKSAWIREQPATTPAKEVVEKAAAAGIKLTLAQVYTARSTGKKPKGKPGPKPGFKAAKATGSVARGSSSDDLLFKRLVLSIGLPKAESYLADLKRSVGL